MTDTITFGPGPVARQVVAEGDGDTLIINQGPATVFFGGSNAIRSTDASGIVPISPNSYFGVNGKSDLYACVASGDTANLEIITGGLNFFLPVTSLTIPYGATGQRIVINPPGFPGSIVGYNPGGLIQFVISPNGYLIYDATGGAFQHLFIAIQNAAGSDTFANPFIKGIQVGPQTGPQVILAGGNPAYIAWPLNDSALFSSPAINGRIVGGVNPNRWGNLAISGSQLPTTGHRDYVMVGLNSPSADGSSFGNGELDWVDTNNVVHGWQVWDGGGVAIVLCRAITAADPSVVATPSVPGVQETWHDMRPLQNSFVGTVAGFLPPQYRKTADGSIQFAGFIRTPPTTGNYNNVTIATLPAAYRPTTNHRVQWLISDVADGAATPKIVVKETGDIVFANMPASLAQTTIGIWGNYELENTGMILS
jgi:hypothetical protein